MRGKLARTQNFRVRVLSAGFSVLGTRFWVQGQGSQCWVLRAGY